MESESVTDRTTDESAAGGSHRDPPLLVILSVLIVAIALGARGLGVHSRSAHPVQYHQEDQEKLEGRVGKKKRWTDDEVYDMARRKTEITMSGNIENTNQELHRCFPERTIESIKGTRRPLA